MYRVTNINDTETILLDGALLKSGQFVDVASISDTVKALKDAGQVTVTSVMDRAVAAAVAALDGIVTGVITRDAGGAAVSASVVFPDGTPGVYTALQVSSSFPGAVDSYQVTYGKDTYVQPTVTRDSNGAVINRPAITLITG